MPLPAEVASGAVLEAFAATVSYRLEPDGWASRFPVVLDHLLAGRLGPADVDAALAELDAIASGLRALPRDRIVFDLADLSRRDDPRARVDRAAATAFGFFVAEDGRPLVDVLREGAMAARAAGRPLGLSTPRAAAQSRQAWALLLIGVAWAVGGAVYLPRLVLVPHGASGAAHGPAAWSLGVVLAAGGASRLLAVKRPAFAAAVRRRGLLSIGIALVLVAALFAVTWR